VEGDELAQAQGTHDAEQPLAEIARGVVGALSEKEDHARPAVAHLLALLVARVDIVPGQPGIIEEPQDRALVAVDRLGDLARTQKLLPRQEEIEMVLPFGKVDLRSVCSGGHGGWLGSDELTIWSLKLWLLGFCLWHAVAVALQRLPAHSRARRVITHGRGQIPKLDGWQVVRAGLDAEEDGWSGHSLGDFLLAKFEQKLLLFLVAGF